MFKVLALKVNYKLTKILQFKIHLRYLVFYVSNIHILQSLSGISPVTLSIIVCSKQDHTKFVVLK